MSKFAAFATFYVDPNQKDTFLSVAREHGVRCIREEPGTLVFDVLTTEADDGVVYLYEVYADKAAFEAHLSGPYFKETFEKLEATLTKEFTYIELALDD